MSRRARGLGARGAYVAPAQCHQRHYSVITRLVIRDSITEFESEISIIDLNSIIATVFEIVAASMPECGEGPRDTAHRLRLEFVTRAAGCHRTGARHDTPRRMRRSQPILQLTRHPAAARSYWPMASSFCCWFAESVCSVHPVTCS